MMASPAFLPQMKMVVNLEHCGRGSSSLDYLKGAHKIILFILLPEGPSRCTWPPLPIFSVAYWIPYNMRIHPTMHPLQLICQTWQHIVCFVHFYLQFHKH